MNKVELLGDILELEELIEKKEKTNNSLFTIINPFIAYYQ